jgi:hypothetical protein
MNTSVAAPPPPLPKKIIPGKDPISSISKKLASQDIEDAEPKTYILEGVSSSLILSFCRNVGKYRRFR